MPFMRKTISPSPLLYFSYMDPDIFISGCDPLTPDDIAEIVVFSATRRENVVLAESLVYPNHQVKCPTRLTTTIILRIVS